MNSHLVGSAAGDPGAAPGTPKQVKSMIRDMGQTIVAVGVPVFVSGAFSAY